MLYFFILAHQADFDVKWCRGTTGEMLFKPWVQRIEQNGAKVLVERRVATRMERSPDRNSPGVCIADRGHSFLSLPRT